MQKKLTTLYHFCSPAGIFNIRVSKITCKKFTGSFMALLFIIIPFFGLTGSENPKSPWEQKNLNNELVNKRNRTSKHFADGAGRASAFISPSSIHYLNESNTWEDISNDILPQNNITHPYVSEHNAIKTYFPANPFTGYILMKAREGNFKEKVSAIRFLDINNKVISSLALSSNVNVTVNKNKITYSGFYPGMSLEYDLGNEMRKFNLVIHSSGFINQIPAGTAYISIAEEFIAENKNIIARTENKEIFFQLENTEILKFSEPVAYDNVASEENLAKGVMTLSGNNGQYQVSTGFPVQWLSDSTRVFPVHLDPIVNYYPQFSTYWTGYQSSSTGKSSGMLRLTTTSTASWAKFDISTLPAGASVTQATFYGYHYQTTGSKIAHIRGLGTVEPVSSAATTIFNQSYNGPSYNNNFTYGNTSYGWRIGALGGTATSDIASLQSQGWFGIGLGYVSGSTSFMYMYGINNSAGLVCYLEVDYFTTPCSGLPAANSVVTPTNMLCPFESAVLTLANTYSVGGITYQWQSSTQSSVGVWTAISGATLQALNTPTTNTDTWYNVVLTCTNVSGITTASVGLVLISPTTTNTVPYYESFESVTVPNRLPNCSWYSPQIGTTAQTYTSSNTLGRVARTGSKFASFYYNPSAINYFYSNGIYMEPGITYSASLWFQTEYYGYNNWTDLSILVGPNQSTTGLVNVASTNGPAISNVYKSLSDTFSVSSPGIYYIAVRGTEGTSSSAQYLTWDDLAVEAPCSLNSPSMGISVTNTSVCQGEPVNFTATGAHTYAWSTGDNGASIATSLNTVGANTVMVLGTNTLSGCTTMVSQKMNVKPTPVINILTGEPAVCPGETSNLTAFGASSYSWSAGGNNPVLSVMPTTNSNYTVLGSNTHGCSGTGVITITVFPLPTVSAVADRQTICMGESVTLTGSGAQDYQWLSGSQHVQLGNPVTVSPSVSMSFTVTGTDANGCTASGLLQMNVDACSGISEVYNGNSLFIYPNPTTGNLTVEINNASAATLEVTDITGRVVFSGSSEEKKINLNLSSLADGIYHLKISTGNSSEVKKIIKQ